MVNSGGCPFVTNPTTENVCGAVADAGDTYLAGEGWTDVSGSTPSTWPTTPGSWTGVDTTVADVESLLQGAGDGAKGIMYVTDGATAHAFNVVNVDGAVIGADFTPGLYTGSITEVAENAGLTADSAAAARASAEAARDAAAAAGDPAAATMPIPSGGLSWNFLPIGFGW